MLLPDCAKKITDYIIKEHREKRLVLPTVLGLQFLEKELGCRAQSIGKAYNDGYITKVLEANGILSKKCGVPRRLMLSEK